MSELRRSWGAFSSAVAERYLSDSGGASETSKRLLADVLAEVAGRRRVAVLDLGCGNGHLYDAFRERGVDCAYTGVDFSEPLLAAARAAHAGDADARFVADDVETLALVEGPFDVAVYSHVLEMLGSPEASLLAARALAPVVLVRFFEPPEHEVDRVELRLMAVAEGEAPVPYLRRSMSRDSYRLMLAKAGCRLVEVYRDATSRDQVHVLRFA